MSARRRDHSLKSQTRHPSLNSTRNLLCIPKVVKAVRNMNTKAPAITCRTSRISQFEDQEGGTTIEAQTTIEPQTTIEVEDDRASAQRSARSTDSKKRVTVSIKKRIVPMDLLTDARVNSGDVVLTDRSNRMNAGQNRQANHRNH